MSISSNRWGYTSTGNLFFFFDRPFALKVKCWAAWDSTGLPRYQPLSLSLSGGLKAVAGAGFVAASRQCYIQSISVRCRIVLLLVFDTGMLSLGREGLEGVSTSLLMKVYGVWGDGKMKMERVIFQLDFGLVEIVRSRSLRVARRDDDGSKMRL